MSFMSWVGRCNPSTSGQDDCQFQNSLGYHREILPHPCTIKSIVYLSFENKFILLILSCNFYLQIHCWKSSSVLRCHHEMED